jgi:NADH:ubiquinone oxidoreductase subunit 6 (subunit J)
MSILFYAIAGLSVAGALAAVLLKNTVHCALALTVAFAGLALLFLELDAQFAGFAQILIYIGAVAILVVFAILLTRGSDTPKDGVYSRGWLVGLVTAAGIFAVLACAVLNSTADLPGPGGAPTAKPQVTVMDIGNALMGRYVVPLEIVALLLTAALIGAVIVAMHEKEGSR